MLAFERIDWHSRKVAFHAISPYLYIWTSKNLLNFAGILHHLLQIGKWSSLVYRCYNKESEDNTFWCIFLLKSIVRQEEVEDNWYTFSLDLKIWLGYRGERISIKSIWKWQRVLFSIRIRVHVSRFIVSRIKKPIE